LKSFFKNINNWQDFTDKLSNLNNKEKGDAFELLTKCYFKIKPQYNHYDDVWLLDEVPQKELDYLKIPSHDIGIDLIAKEGKEYYAIQCKYHSDENKNVNLKEVSTFLSQVAANKRISMGYLCSSGIDTSKNYQKSHKKEIQEILVDSWQLLDKVFFDNVRRLLSNKKVKEKPYKPRKHQKKAIKEAKKHFVKEGNDRGKLIFPCGAGKSLTGYWLTEVLDSKSTLIAVPSLSLVKQTLEVYLREIVANGLKVKWLCICSDEGIGTGDDVATMTNNIGVPCKTDPEYIKNWLKTNKNEHKIVFTTYQSGHLIADISKKLKMSFDVGIFDEAHKTVGNKLKVFSRLLFEKNISIKKRIFMTATERFYKGDKDDIISMDDDDVYGETFSYMSFKEAIESDLLTDYKIITIDIKKSEISDFIKENNLVQLNGKWKKETEARSLASMLALRKAMKRFDIKNVVSFHSSIEKAKRNKELQQYITDTYNYKPIDTYTVSGKIPTTKRNVIVQEFAKSDRALITNARCLTEGIDVPNIDCIVFADPRKSKVDIVQALGRALRKKDGKEWGYVILPVVYDGDTNEIDNDNFNEIVNIVRGLAANDERIIEYFKEKGKKGKGSGDMIKGSDVFSIDSSMLEEKDLIGHLQIKLWEKLSRFQWMPFEEARDFVRKLNLKGRKDWRKYINSKQRAYFIPAKPKTVYQDKGWVSWPDWYGTKPGWDGKYLTFKEARKFVWTLKLQNYDEWYEYAKSGKKPYNIPTEAYMHYSKEWVSRYDWIGTHPGWDGKYLSYKESRKFVRKLNIPNQKEWYKYTRTKEFPWNIPASPTGKYKNKGWVSWKDWLGYKDFRPNDIDYLPFEEARKFVWTLKLKDGNEWKEYCKSGKKPINIPYNVPGKMYKNEWISMPDWLGTRKGWKPGMYHSFEDARNYVRKLKLKSRTEWTEYCKSEDQPYMIPSKPNEQYRNDGWLSWPDWLGTKPGWDGKFLPFKEAREVARSLNIKSYKEWKEKCKDLYNIPHAASKVYKDDWKGIEDWLGYKGKIYKGKYLSYKEARKFAHTLKLKKSADWSKFCKSGKKPEDIPVGVVGVYKNNGWVSWGDFLGTGVVSTKSRIFWKFEKARDYVRKLNLKSKTEYSKLLKEGKIPESIPSGVFGYYKDKGWISWPDWLGTKPGWDGKKVDYNTARNFSRKLNLKSIKEWMDYRDKLPYSIPVQPKSHYKDKGWVNWEDFLGNKIDNNWTKNFVTYEECKKYFSKLNLQSNKEWRTYKKKFKRPPNIPANPEQVYKGLGWKGWRDFLGND
jgi:superfamily II DNA or RNA helicase